MSTPADAVDKSLFTDVLLPGAADVANEATAVRTRVVEVNFEVLAAAKGTSKAAFDGGSRLGLNLFTDMALTAILERLEARSPHDFTWVGSVEGDKPGHVTLVVKDGVMVGNIRLPKAFYQVRYAGHGRHIISEHTYEDPFPHQDPIPVALPANAPAQGHDALLADDGLTIDLLVVYTAAARAAARGTTAMQALIELAVSETNTAYDNSDVAQRLRLVRTAEVAYTETGDIFTELERLRQPADGFMDNVHTLRDTSGADVVALLVERASYCGVGYLMQTPSHAFADYAFGVVLRSCATGNYSFGHELGHIMGSDHDQSHSSGGGSYPYSFGYQAPNRAFRDVMAYDCPGGCPRVLHFSNPDVNYLGQPTGVKDRADNARSLNNTGTIVANFRSSVNSPTSPDITVSPAGFTFGVIRVGSSSPAQSFTIDNQGTADLQLRALSLGGADAQEFVVQQDRCSTQLLSPKASCTVTLVFAPVSTGSKQAALAVSSNDPDTPTLTIALRGTGQSGELAEIDHFKCYTARTARGTPAFTPQEVRLSDAFETKVTNVMQTTTVCNPVDVNGAGILDPAAHLTCHQIRDVPGQPYFKARDVVVDNAFGTETLTVSGAQTLCVPSTQNNRMFADLNIDHFKCYTAWTARSTPAFTPQEVRLSDAFETKVSNVVQTTTVCNPVDVNGAGILDPAAHLTCHQIRDVPGQPYFKARDVVVDNAFGTETLTVSGAQTLCVPSAQVPR